MTGVADCTLAAHHPAAQVHGNMYGTSLKAVADVNAHGGKVAVLDIDVQGAEQVGCHLAWREAGGWGLSWVLLRASTALPYAAQLPMLIHSLPWWMCMHRAWPRVCALLGGGTSPPHVEHQYACRIDAGSSRHCSWHMSRRPWTRSTHGLSSNTLLTPALSCRQVRGSVLGLSALLLFVAPPSMEELERRLRGRGTEEEDKVLKRLAGAKAELARAEVSTGGKE
jgi:hypothetical protein